MRVLLINSVCGVGSTGRICEALARAFEQDGHEVRIAYGRSGRVPKESQGYAVRIGTAIDVAVHGLLSRLFDAHGIGSLAATKRFLRWAEGYHPDLLWLHNIHGYYIHYELLFNWIKSHPEIEVRWTLHDCWAFTGHCTHFSAAGCDRWKKGCFRCPERGRYPASWLADRCQQNFERKRCAFTGVSRMTLITPSQWLADLTGQSFLKEYPIRVEANPLDRSVFRPTSGVFRARLGLEDKKIILGVASVWNDRKGLGDFIRLAGMLEKDWVIVLVGLTHRQIRSMPEGMVCLPRTDDPRELAGIYTAADVFVNPSREETFGMTVAEAQACGTPAIVYEGTACAEIVKRGQGMVVSQGAEALLQAIRTVLAP